MDDKILVWLIESPKTPLFGEEARRTAGFLLRQLQQGEIVEMPHSRPMPAIGKRCHELRIKDGKENATWRIIYRVDADAIIVAEFFDKNDNKTPRSVIDNAKSRLSRYDAARKKGKR